MARKKRRGVHTNEDKKMAPPEAGRWEEGIMGKFLFRVLIVLMVIVVVWLAFARLTGRRVSIFGLTLCAIESGSMEPEFERGSLIIVHEPGNGTRITQGDIITYERARDRKLVTHRVIEVVFGEDGIERYRTKGDANESADPDLVMREAIVGVFLLKIK